MLDSALSLAPRGYGRTSFHLIEALQLGLVPIQVHLDDGAGGGGGGDDDHQSKCVCRSDADEDEEEAWVPYELSAFRKVGFTTSLSELQPLLRGLFSACGGEAQPAVVHHSASPSEDEKIKEAPAEASLALSRAGAERLEGMEDAARALRRSHFSYEGALTQIARFMRSLPVPVRVPGDRPRVAASDSDLVCRPLPRSPV